MSSALRTYLRRCLQKEPKQRVRDIGDVRLAMEGAFESTVSQPSDVAAMSAPPQPVGWRRAVLLSSVTLVVGSLITGLAMWSLTVAPAIPRPVSRFAVTLPETDVIDTVGGIALSPDGDRLVYSAARGTVRQLFVRDRDQLEAIPIRGTEDAVHPFFSPDGAWVGFFTGSALKKVALAGGPPVALCDAELRFGASWGPDDTIVFASNSAPGLMRVSASGGEPQPLTTPDPEEGTHRWPEFLPDGQAVLFTVAQGTRLSEARVAVVSLETGEQQMLVDGADGHFASSGHLVFGREASLWAAQFDPERLEVTGEPAPVVEGVQVNLGGWTHYALANDGALVYLPSVGAGSNLTLVWVDRQGQEEPLPGIPLDFYTELDISPDGTQVAVRRGEDVWTYDVARATLSRLTTDPAEDGSSLWTLDGERVVFYSTRDGQPMLFSQAGDGPGDVERLLTREDATALAPRAWSPDGTRLVFDERVPGTGDDIWVLSMEGEPAAEVLIQTEFREQHAALSHAGRWIAYSSDLSGQVEVYVQRFPDLGNRLRISANGGREPLWAPDGGGLFYRSVDGSQMMVVAIDSEPVFTVGTPQLLFEGRYHLTGGPTR